MKTSLLLNATALGLSLATASLAAAHGGPPVDPGAVAAKLARMSAKVELPQIVSRGLPDHLRAMPEMQQLERRQAALVPGGAGMPIEIAKTTKGRIIALHPRDNRLAIHAEDVAPRWASEQELKEAGITSNQALAARIRQRHRNVASRRGAPKDDARALHIVNREIVRLQSVHSMISQALELEKDDLTLLRQHRGVTVQQTPRATADARFDVPLVEAAGVTVGFVSRHGRFEPFASTTKGWPDPSSDESRTPMLYLQAGLDRPEAVRAAVRARIVEAAGLKGNDEATYVIAKARLREAVDAHAKVTEFVSAPLRNEKLAVLANYRAAQQTPTEATAQRHAYSYDWRSRGTEVQLAGNETEAVVATSRALVVKINAPGGAKYRDADWADLRRHGLSTPAEIEAAIDRVVADEPLGDE